ncbi:MAG: hypothetical protein H0U98_05325 [Alphaproteobacteria bacterium]|nr:hypothetical protein [Alphaproteobacteria bacterium]
MTSKPALMFALFLMPASVCAEEEAFAPMALNSFTLLPRAFASAKVMGQDGALLGNIQIVQSDPAGKPDIIRIGVVGGKIVALRSNDASYEQKANIVVTDMDAMKAALAGVVSQSP